MSAVAAPSDRRFRRAHVKPSRRRRRWQTLVKPALIWMAAGVIAAYAAYRLTDVVVHAHALQVRQISVRGNERLSTGEVVAMLSGLKGESIVWADLKSWRRTLMASAWVRDAALRRSLPSTVEVVIWERQPVGVGRINGEMYLIDERGVVIDEYGPEHASFDLPIVDGLSIRSTDGHAMVDEARAELAAHVIAALRSRPAIGKRLSQVDVSDAHDAVVILDDDRSAIHLGEDHFAKRVESYLELRSELQSRVPEIDSVDLRFDDRIYVRPASARSSRAGRMRDAHSHAPDALRRGKLGIGGGLDKLGAGRGGSVQEYLREKPRGTAGAPARGIGSDSAKARKR
jgi:cell division septal protein FtsQ